MKIELVDAKCALLLEPLEPDHSELPRGNSTHRSSHVQEKLIEREERVERLQPCLREAGQVAE